MKGETTGQPASVAGRPATPGLSPVAALVRRHDPDRYKTALFARADRRETLLTLYAFNYEIARVRESVTQPMLGQIRLQWWREVIEAAYAGAPTRQHEVVAPLTAVIREHRLTRVHFDRLIDARERDLIDEPPATMSALETYAEGTSANLIRLALEILTAGQGSDRGQFARGAAETAALHVGIGYALAGLLRALPFHARSGRCYIPEEIAAAAGLDPRDYSELRDTPALRVTVAQIAETAAAHLVAARRQFAMPRSILPTLLPAVIAERALTRLRRTAWNPFDTRLATPDPFLTWRLAGRMLLGRF